MLQKYHVADLLNFYAIYEARNVDDAGLQSALPAHARRWRHAASSL